MTRGAESKQNLAQRKRKNNNDKQRTDILEDYLYSDDYRWNYCCYRRRHWILGVNALVTLSGNRKWKLAPLRQFPPYDGRLGD